jgi:hypothetical protein
VGNGPWFGLATFLLGPMLTGIFTAVIRPLIDKATSENTGAAIELNFGIISLILSIFAIVTGIRAFKKANDLGFCG